MQDEVIASLGASAARRWFGVVTLAALGALLIYVALVTPPSALGWQVFLLVIGGAAVWLADATRRATVLSVELTRAGLRDSAGEVIAPIEQIERIERGVFAFKPSNGFSLVLKEPRERAWRPGLWWSLGRRVGIGGVTPGAQGKAMAQMLEAMVVERNQDSQTS